MKFNKTSKLIVLGNLNIHSLINSIIKATMQLRENEKNKDSKFNQIHIFHTEKSIKALMSTSLKWREELLRHEISHTSLIHYTTKIEDSSEDRFKDLVEQLRDIVKPLEKQEYYIDLSGSISSLKSILAVFAYVLDIENIYTIEIQFDDDREKSAIQKRLFYSDLEKEGVEINYKKFPSVSKFDEFGKHNLTKIIRYRKTFENLEQNLRLLGISNNNVEYIKDSLITGANSHLSGEVYKNKNDIRNSVFSYSAAVEEMSNILLKSITEDAKLDGYLGTKLEKIRDEIKINPNYFINFKVLENLTLLIGSIRNDIIHPDANKKNDFETLNAHSNVLHQIVMAFINFASKALDSFKDKDGNLLSIAEIQNTDSETEYYFGFDGDNTGDFLDDSFKDNDQQVLIDKSNKIRKAISKIKSKIKKSTSNSNSILFAEGDNILFKMKYDKELLKKIQQTYQEETGMCSSIGYGETLQESAIALKLSKSNNGNTILSSETKIN